MKSHINQNTGPEEKILVFFLAHIDDFEFSCLGFLYENHHLYTSIKIVTATTWPAKTIIWQQNLKKLAPNIFSKITDVNLGYPQRRLMERFDDVKEDFYKQIEFHKRFDLVTHDSEDCHTDHIVLNRIAKGIYKFASRFVTIFSPSSINFSGNYFIGISEDLYALKKSLLDKYDINNEQSFTRLGYYLQSEEHYNIARTYVISNYAFDDFKTYEIYKILKWL